MNRDRVALVMLMLAGALLAGRAWLHENPQHDPFAPLSLDHPPGWATGHKLANLRADLPGCRQVLTDGAVEFTALEPEGEGACHRADRTQAQAGLLAPVAATMTCQTMLSYEMWLRHAVQPAAQQLLASPITRIEHLGTGNVARFLRQVRDRACTSFATVLSPDYNAAHADHLHLDQAARRLGGVCC